MQEQNVLDIEHFYLPEEQQSSAEMTAGFAFLQQLKKSDSDI